MLYEWIIEFCSVLKVVKFVVSDIIICFILILINSNF